MPLLFYCLFHFTLLHLSAEAFASSSYLLLLRFFSRSATNARTAAENAIAAAYGATGVSSPVFTDVVVVAPVDVVEVVVPVVVVVVVVVVTSV